MFLVTTADQRFWKTDEPILFLGEWCKLYSQKGAWEELSYDVLPYHWDDRTKFYRDYLYLNTLYEHILSELSQGLNQIHSVKQSIRYWRIIIGRWLSFFIQIYHDRYQSILAAAASGKVTRTLIGKYDREEWVPRDYRVFDGWAIEDDYNHYLYSRLIECTNGMPFDAVDVTRDSTEVAKHRNTNKLSLSTFKTSLRHFLGRGSKLTPGFLNQIVFVSPPFRMNDLTRLQLSLGQLPYVPPQYLTPPDSPVDWNLREKLSCTSSTSEFEQLLSNIIVEQIPTVYVEGFAEMNEASLRTYPKNAKAVVVGSDFNSNDGFKMWVAHNADRGVKFAGVQYGGHYGTGLWSSTEEHEISIYDRYYTWGWDLKEKQNVVPLPLVKFNSTKRNIQPKKHGRLLLVSLGLPRYSYYMYSIPVASTGMLSYFDDQYRFVRALSEESQSLLLVRPYLLNDYGWDEKDRWADELPEIECYDGSKSMTEQLAESSLFIGTYNATTYLETFAVNHPSVLFWNPDHWELNETAQPYFEELCRVGILHYTPESAAKKVNEICNDPLSWWQQSGIQQAKDNFCRRFAHTSNDWLRQWKSELKRLKD